MNLSLSSTMKAAIRVGILCLARNAKASEIEDAPIVEMLGQLNLQLAERDEPYQVESIGMYATTDSAEMGRVVFASDRGNKQSPSDFVPFDSRRAWGPLDSSITTITDSSQGATTSGLSSDDTTAVIGRAMQTWEDVTCSNIPLVDYGGIDFDLGLVQFLLGFGGSPLVFADIMHGGFLPASFFDSLAPGGSNFILAVAFTFTFIDDVDTDGDGKPDTALRDIYYNDNFGWGIDTNVDVETVALHEAGHGLSQAHFGDIFRTEGNGKVHYAPRAVMNAAYSGIQQKLTGTDEAGHCSIWASWPNN